MRLGTCLAHGVGSMRLLGVFAWPAAVQAWDLS
jgi:hypothetical protein